MAERKGPGENEDGPDPVESGHHDGRGPNEEASADDARTEGDGAYEDKSRTGPEEHTSDGETADIVAFSPRAGADSTEAGDTVSGDEDELVDLDELSDEDLVDLSVLQADDALLDALGGTDPGVPEASGDHDSSVEELLVSWRREVDAAPMEELVDVDTAVATVAAAQRPKRGLRRWHLVPVASAAAVLMILSTGVGLAAKDALPGDMLWGVTEILYSDHADAAKAQEKAQEDLDRARAAWERGSRDEASNLLDSAHTHMRDVDKEHGLPSLEAAHRSLANEVGKPLPPPPESTSSVVSSELPTDSSEFPTSSSVPGPTETETSEPTSSEEPSDTSSVPSPTSDPSDEPSSDTSMLDSDSDFPGIPTPGQ